jgi:hypothetical protein
MHFLSERTVLLILIDSNFGGLFGESFLKVSNTSLKVSYSYRNNLLFLHYLS